MGEGFILVGVDGSESSIDALHWASNQAKLTGASLRVVTTWHYPVSLGWAPAWPDDWNPEAEAKTALGELVKRELGTHDGIEVAEQIIEGHPAEVLVALTEKEKPDLLVVGSRGHGAFSGIVLGSVSEYCAEHASCPVVVVRHPHEQAKG
jgi:nucleotide-binding universal stress UspA family protein